MSEERRKSTRDCMAGKSFLDHWNPPMDRPLNRPPDRPLHLGEGRQRDGLLRGSEAIQLIQPISSFAPIAGKCFFFNLNFCGFILIFIIYFFGDFWCEILMLFYLLDPDDSLPACGPNMNIRLL